MNIILKKNIILKQNIILKNTLLALKSKEISNVGL